MTQRCPDCGSALATIDGLCPACLARNMAALLSQESSSSDAPPIPGYELGPLLGRGGMGTVFRARRIADGTEVAVKVAMVNSAQAAALMERLAREAAALARLEHPNILRVLDSGTTGDGRFFLVTELAEGGDLAQRLEAGPLTATKAAQLFRETASAVQAAHEAGILHRDIKPANVLLDATGSARLADFSLARLLQADGSPAFSLTGGGDVFGTPYYLAPETRRGAATIDARADIFALGVLLHEMLTGRVPIGHYVPASQVANLPPAVDALIARCLAEDPAARPADVQTLLKEFDQAWKARSPFPKSTLLITVAAIVILSPLVFLFKPGGPRSSAAVQATRSRPFVNSLGMQFVPAPGTAVLFSIWETRRRDFAAFASNAPDRVARAEAAWRNAPGQPTPEHPVSSVDLPTALLFCDWLTMQERALGRIGSNDTYRLPTDEEWSRAAGLREETGATPQERDAAMSRGRGYYAWGRTWPPPERGIPANFAADEANDVGRRSQLRSRDAWAYTAPVGSFPPNDAGLFDMSGNVAEWCDSAWNQSGEEKVLRGGSWNQSSPAALRLTTRQSALPVGHMPGAGFRVVLQTAPPTR